MHQGGCCELQGETQPPKAIHLCRYRGRGNCRIQHSVRSTFPELSAHHGWLVYRSHYVHSGCAHSSSKLDPQLSQSITIGLGMSDAWMWRLCIVFCCLQYHVSWMGLAVMRSQPGDQPAGSWMSLVFTPYKLYYSGFSTLESLVNAALERW